MPFEIASQQIEARHRLGQDRAPQGAAAGRRVGRRDRRRPGPHPRQRRQDRIAGRRDLHPDRPGRAGRRSQAQRRPRGRAAAARRRLPRPRPAILARCDGAAGRRPRLDPAGLARSCARCGDREAAAAPGIRPIRSPVGLSHPAGDRPPPVRPVAARRREAEPGADDAGAADQRIAGRGRPRHRRGAEGHGRRPHLR